jgi:hypothetical protein
VGVNKAFFRYLRGELLNGFYIRKLNLTAEKLTSLSLLKAELLYWLNTQLTIDDSTFSMRHEDISGIAQVAGILSIRGASEFLDGWFMLSESFIVGPSERSERGLLDQATGLIEYVRTTQDTYPTDIVTMATTALRMSLIPDGTVPIGYVWGDGAGVLDDTGMVIEDLLHLTPPAGYVYNSGTGHWDWPLDYQTNPPPAFAPWYGNQFLPLAQTFPLDITLPDNILLMLLEAQQNIKYQGLNLKCLLDITELMIPDLISNLKIELLESMLFHVWHNKMTFTRIETNFSNNNGWGRFAAWMYFVESKFPFIQFNEAGV